MTEEAFIRAVVDHPGQDAPRLDYDAWLDTHGAPDRAAYLRAEAARPGAVAVPRGIDPVWIARVSRPPAGVCCDHLARSAVEGPTSDADIDTAAAELSVVFPGPLRALLLNYRLGHLRNGPFVLPDADGPGLAVDGFVCLSDSELEDGTVSHELVERTLWLRDEFGLRSGFVYLAETFHDAAFVADCRGRSRGAVRRFDPYPGPDHPAPAYTRIASSVGAFLARLEPRT